jgi:hypothetical protein
MYPVLYNAKYGGFGLSDKAIALYKSSDIIDNDLLEYIEDGHFPRNHLPLIQLLFDKLGLEASSGKNAALKLAFVPTGFDFQIPEYDGKEYVVDEFPTHLIVDDLLGLIKNGDQHEHRSLLTSVILEDDVRFQDSMALENWSKKYATEAKKNFMANPGPFAEMLKAFPLNQKLPQR